ncbi:Rho guanine nucleotide exchange factor, putative [Hondaea fermentalgiana]|uniref:Rho guanine nucleotide exchange factor, putative n=1 Tax=Hondaea fermentalgiana TaxID=2315210 RepID=A0A2R5GXJ8_9STRA|nr:Rho guanine nucleotide exchange factor, putative [Hondaea fermentalgiana]|eukprot:GBG33423.1 Rho guanine nucleotide exchange factor, putative [Hondaea fermentalgiana]
MMAAEMDRAQQDQQKADSEGPQGQEHEQEQEPEPWHPSEKAEQGSQALQLSREEQPEENDGVKPPPSKEDEEWMQAAFEGMGVEDDRDAGTRDEDDGEMTTDLPPSSSTLPFDEIADTFAEYENVPTVDAAHLDRLIEELVTSEARYVEFLESLLEVYMSPIEEMDELWKREVMNRREVAATFSYIGQIRILGAELLAHLQRRLARVQSDSDESATKIKMAKEACSAVTRFASLFKLYARYAATFYRSTQALVELQAQEPGFASFLRARQPAARGQSIDALLIMPVQRLPRFQLFLKQVIGALETYGADADEHKHIAQAALETATRTLDCVENAIQYVDNSVQDEKDYGVLVDLQARLAADQLDVVSGFADGRRLLKQGELTKASKEGSKMEKLHFVLLTDILFYAESRNRDGKLRLRRELPRGSFSAHAAEADREEDYGYEGKRLYIDTASKRLDLFALSKHERDTWLEALQDMAQEPKSYEQVLEHAKQAAKDAKARERTANPSRTDSVEDLGALERHNDYEVTSTAAAQYARDLEAEAFPQSEAIQVDHTHAEAVSDSAEAAQNIGTDAPASLDENIDSDDYGDHDQTGADTESLPAEIDVEIADDAALATAALNSATRNKAAPPSVWDSPLHETESPRATSARDSIRRGPTALTEALIEGEQTYADELSVLLRVFVQPMLDISVGGHLKYEYDRAAMRKARSLLAGANVQVCLHSLVQLELLQQGIVDLFRNEWQDFIKQAQTSPSRAPPAVQIPEFVPEVFETIIALLALYSSYIERHEALMETLQLPTMEDLRRSLERHEACKGKPMHVFLSAPVARPLYYRQLVDEFVQASKDFQSSEAIQARLEQCKTALQEVEARVNVASSRHQNTEDLLRVERSLTPTRSGILNRAIRSASSRKLNSTARALQSLGTSKKSPEIVKTSRRLLLEADMVKVCSRRPKRRHFWLFNDMFMYGIPVSSDVKTYHFREAIPISNCFAVAARDRIEISRAPEAHQARVGSAVLSSFESLLENEESSLEQLATARSGSEASPYFDLDVNAFQIRSTVKSFVIIAPSVAEKHRWAVPWVKSA